jgi:hypothetical protein
MSHLIVIRDVKDSQLPFTLRLFCDTDIPHRSSVDYFHKAESPIVQAKPHIKLENIIL